VVVAGRPRRGRQAAHQELRSLGAEAESLTPMSARRTTSATWFNQTVAGLAASSGRRGEQRSTEGQVGPITDRTAESFAATFETNVLAWS